MEGECGNIWIYIWNVYLYVNEILWRMSVLSVALYKIRILERVTEAANTAGRRRKGNPGKGSAAPPAGFHKD